MVVGGGERAGPPAALGERLGAAGVAAAAVRHVAGEPTVADADEGAAAARAAGCDVVAA